MTKTKQKTRCHRQVPKPKSSMKIDQLPLDIAHIIFQLIPSQDQGALRLASRKLHGMCHAIHYCKIPYFNQPLKTRVKTMQLLEQIVDTFADCPEIDCNCMQIVKTAVKKNTLADSAFFALDEIKALEGRFVPFAAVNSTEPWHVKALFRGCESGASCLDLELDLKHVESLGICRDCALDDKLINGTLAGMRNLKDFQIVGPHPDNNDSDVESDDYEDSAEELENPIADFIGEMARQIRREDSPPGYQHYHTRLFPSLPFYQTPQLASFGANFCSFSKKFSLPNTLQTLQLANCSFEGTGIRDNILALPQLRRFRCLGVSREMRNCHGSMKPLALLDEPHCPGCEQNSAQTNKSIRQLHVCDDAINADFRVFEVLKTMRFDVVRADIEDVEEFLMKLRGHPTLEDVTLGFTEVDFEESEHLEGLRFGFTVQCRIIDELNSIAGNGDDDF